MGFFDFLKRPTTRGLTAQGQFLKELITGKTTAEERAAELKKFGTGLLITAPIISLGAIPGAAPIVLRFIPKIIKPIISAVVRKPALAIVGAGVLVSGAAPTIVKGLFKAGKVTGEVITGEKELTTETITDVAKGLGIVAGLGAAGLVVGAVGKKILEKKEGVPQEIPGLIADKPMGILGEVPITPLTTDITKEKRPYKRRRAKITPSVKQYVRINIINRPIATGVRITNKRYLNAIPC